MSWNTSFHSEAIVDKLHANLLRQASNDLQDRTVMPSAEDLETFAKRAVEIAIEDTLTVISEWDFNSETFHDAFKMTLQKAHRKFLKLLSDSDDFHAEENALKQGRPEMPQVDTKHADVILDGREPSHLKQMYSEVMDTSIRDQRQIVQDDNDDTVSWKKPKAVKKSFFRDNAQDDD